VRLIEERFRNSKLKGKLDVRRQETGVAKATSTVADTTG